MSVFCLLILACGIIGLWVFTGRYEYQIPVGLTNKIVSWQRPEKDREVLAELVLNIEAREFITENMEKEIYIVRKSRKQKNNYMLMNVGIEIAQNPPDHEEIEKAKQRLEKRFPGLTVNFSSKGQEVNNAVLCSD